MAHAVSHAAKRTVVTGPDNFNQSKAILVASGAFFVATALAANRLNGPTRRSQPAQRTNAPVRIDSRA
jgi:hypothetical protein